MLALVKMTRAARGVWGGYSPSPQENVVFFKSNPAFYTFLKEIKLVEKVDFPQYINIWYIFLDLKKNQLPE